MKLLEKILFPVDFGKDMLPGIKMVQNLAARFNSELILLNVLPAEASQGEFKTMAENFASSEFDKLITSISMPGLSVIRKIRYGQIAEEIMEAAEEDDVNVIVVPALSAPEPGSITEKIIRKSSKPVWLFKYGFPEIPDRILCPVDFSFSSERALRNAINISRRFRAELYVINVFEPFQNIYSPRFQVNYTRENERLENENKNKFNVFLNRFDFSGVEYETEILAGNVHEIINRFIASRNISLTFMGSTGKTMINRFILGSITEKVSHHLPSSLVITKSENLVDTTLDMEISGVGRYLSMARRMETEGRYQEAIEQLNHCMEINDMLVPVLAALVRIYEKTGDSDLAKAYRHKTNEILERFWEEEPAAAIKKFYKL